MKIIFQLIIAFAISWLYASSSFASSFDCNGKIVSSTDTKETVTMKCGAPSWKETHEVKRFTVEKWFYNFGPNHFVQILTFKNSSLSDIKTGGYGYNEEKISDVQCGGRVLAINDLQPEVIAKCGKPTYKEKIKNKKKRVTINAEKWTYNFGPNYLILILEFRNGKLVSIKNGGFGY